MRKLIGLKDKLGNILYSKDILEQGDNFVKFANGLLICWDKKTETYTLTEVWESNYFVQQSYTYPQPFIDVPITIPFAVPSGFLIRGELANVGNLTKEKTAIRLVSNLQLRNVSITNGYFAIGWWK